jgi:hypothetical protein
MTGDQRSSCARDAAWIWSPGVSRGGPLDGIAAEDEGTATVCVARETLLALEKPAVDAAPHRALQ